VRKTTAGLLAILLAGWSAGLFGGPSGLTALDGPELQAAQPTRDWPIRPLPYYQVQPEDGFWQARLKTSREITVPYCLEQCEKTGRISNFAKAGGLMEGKFEGIYFNDSDLYKILEGAAYTLKVHPDPELDKYVDRIISYIAAAQEDDGYLYTARTLAGPDYMPPGGPKRWSAPGGHELYCVGHLYEAAVAHFQATGKRTLLDVALKNADLICKTFGPDKLTWPPGHEEIEIGLVKLYRATGDEKYLRQAEFFLDLRGREDTHRLYGPYSQDHQTVAEQREAVGHAVRAGYLYTGMADVAVLRNNKAWFKALDAIWADIVGKKLYVTGGVGARGGGEAFGAGYELPNLNAYCETCAAIANVLFNQRMFLRSGDGRYMDVLERSLYNGVLPGVGLDGKSFFYTNVLESDGRHQRSPWFGCACCPSNIARFIPAVPGYAYASGEGAIYVNLFMAGRATIDLDGQRVQLHQQTDYPWSGQVKIVVEPARDDAEFALKVRVPGWARNQPVPGDLYRFLESCDEKPRLKLNGQVQPIALDKGYAVIERKWRRGDSVELVLPMPVRRLVAHEAVEADRGRVALQRGPLVYCVEWPDVRDGKVLCLMLPDKTKLVVRHRPDLLGGVTVIAGQPMRTRFVLENGEKKIVQEPGDVAAIPYYAWAHRGRGEMAVWLARTKEAARPLPAPTIAAKAKARASGGDVAALNDQREPKSSGDHSSRFLHWWPRKGTAEWVEYEFAQATRVSAVEVYWFDDTGRGECRLPVSWRLLYRQGEQWKPVSNPSGYGCEKDKYNRTTFDPVVTTGLRIEVQLPEKFSAGIHEWKVDY